MYFQHIKQHNIMKYIIYLRVSTDSQVQSGLGLEAQRNVCLKYIKDSPCSILEFADEGFSGALSLDKRPALLSAISNLDKDDILLISQRDRIGRDPIVNAMIERAVIRKKARLISANGDVSEANDPSSILMKRMVDAFAEYERLIIGARTKAALAIKKTRNERVGYIPYGYRLCIDNVHLEEDEHEQQMLKMISTFRSQGLSLRKIANELNKSLLVNRQQNIWNHVSISRVMK